MISRKKPLRKIALPLLLFAACVLAVALYAMRNTASPPYSSLREFVDLPDNQLNKASNTVSELLIESVSDGFASPLSRATERVTKKPFGIYIDPATSLVQPERFSGYHTGTDFEILPGEEDEDVAVSAICSGELLSKRPASGYGGVLVQSCEYEDEPVTVVYGHVRLSSVEYEVGDEILAGELLGHLGTGFSIETDGERKHLHLSIHRGTEEDIRGYVASAAELSDWIDPCLLFCE